MKQKVMIVVISILAVFMMTALAQAIEQGVTSWPPHSLGLVANLSCGDARCAISTDITSAVTIACGAKTAAGYTLNKEYKCTGLVKVACNPSGAFSRKSASSVNCSQLCGPCGAGWK